MDAKYPVEQINGATTLGEAYDVTPAIREIECVRQIYELFHGLEANRRARVFRYVSEILGEEE